MPVPIFLAVQMLMAEAWRNERLINHFRTAVFTVAVVFGSITTLILLGRPHAAIFIVGGWAIFIAIFNATWFKRHFHPAVPWILSFVEIALIGIGFLLSRPVIQMSRPDLADRQLGMLPTIFLALVCSNMLRFSWRLSIFSALFAVALLVSIYAAAGLLDSLVVPLCLLILSIGVAVAYTARRFERLLQRQAIDMRRIQRERIASLRSLVAGVCHELNNPLGALVSNAQVSQRSLEMLGDPEKRERALAALTKISSITEEATSRISETIGSLKRFARLDEAEVKVTRMEEMIDDALALLSTEMESIAVEKHLAQLGPITCRPGEINQVLMHIFRNAAQAGAKRIQIRTAEVPEGVRVEIEDDGRGIPEELLEKIFDPTFFRSGDRMKMGFGLSASQSIVEDHGGWLAIESVPGKGTTVRIVIRPNPTDGR